MAKETIRTEGSSASTAKSPLEAMQEQALIGFIKDIQGFLKDDGRINAALADIMETLAKYSADHPEVLASNSNGNVDELIRAFKLKGDCGCGDTKVSGNDFVGGDWIDDVGRFINNITDLVSKEKKFFMGIIMLVFCGKDAACKCLCEYISSN